MATITITRTIISLFAISLNLNAYALTLRVTNKNNEILFEQKTNANVPAHVGQVSVDVFKAYGITYEGGTYGMKSIFSLGNDIEILSDTEMKAYGWCFSVDGFTPETMADQTFLQNEESVIEWYYAYAHYKMGEWIGQCVRDKSENM